MIGKTAVSGPKGLGRGEVSAEKLGEIAPRPVVADRARRREGSWASWKPCAVSSTRPASVLNRRFEDKVEAAARRRTDPRRDEDGQGVCGGEAQAAAGRQNGRPSRQQGRHLPSILPIEDMPPPGRRHLRRRGSEPAGRAVAHERRSDLRNAPRLGFGRSRKQIASFSKPGRAVARSAPEGSAS